MDKIQAQSTLKKRYTYKLSTNLVALFINLFTQAIIPRGLGPKIYGDFSFLTNFFTQVTGFLDMGTSTALYTKLSQRPGETALRSFYLRFMIALGLAMILFVGSVFALNMEDRLWPGESGTFIWMATIWGFMAWVVIIFNGMVDAYGLTVPGEKARIAQKIIGLLLIGLIFIFGQLNLNNFFYYNYLIFLFLIICFAWIIHSHGNILIGDKLTSRIIKDYIKEFYEYCNPLLAYSLVGLITAILDRWILQIFSGSVEQGFFGLSSQIGGICFLFTSAMTPLLMREFSIAFAENNLNEMAGLFRRYVPLLYATAAYFSCFMAMQAKNITLLFGGGSFKGATLAVMIMAFYPVHQTYGQLSGAVYFATGQTKLFRNIVITFMVLGLPITWIMLAPIDKYGLNMGATGLAIKTVLLQFIAVNVQLYYNARFLEISFWKYLIHQLGSIMCLLLLAGITTFGIRHILGSGQDLIAELLPEILKQMSSNAIITALPEFLLSGIIYTLFVILLVWYYPVVFGLKKQELFNFLQGIKKRLS